jgi:putative endonuclease
MMQCLRKLLRRLAGRSDAGLPASARLGRKGEREAGKHLRRQGYAILERNYRIRQGEIDLIAFRDGVLAFVEVRSQTQPAMIDPLRTITRRKQRRVIKAAQTYTALNDLSSKDVRLRFDVVTVLFDEGGRVQDVNHIEGAFHESPKGFS